LASDATMKELHQKIRDAQKENDELTSKLAKKERECEVKMEEQVNVYVNIKIRAGTDIHAYGELTSSGNSGNCRPYFPAVNMKECSQDA